jgi:hypothetical protein
MRLGVMGRSLVVATVFWIIGWASYRTRDTIAFLEDAYANFLAMNCKNPFHPERCEAAKTGWHPQPTSSIILDAVVEAALYAAAAWLVIGVVYLSIRWVLAGRSPRLTEGGADA